LIAAHQEIASLILHFEIDSYRFFGGQKFVREISETVITSAAHHSKPVTVVLATAGIPEAMELITEAQQRFHDAGVPVYPTIARAAQAISKLLLYPQFTGNP
ncbi:MAG: hypothetical protein SVM79_05610, partial [Chloroflexota bacterium]|nr:hypothetical protein [Chloroflexota bacterium]